MFSALLKCSLVLILVKYKTTLLGWYQYTVMKPNDLTSCVLIYRSGDSVFANITAIGMTDCAAYGMTTQQYGQNTRLDMIVFLNLSFTLLLNYSTKSHNLALRHETVVAS